MKCPVCQSYQQSETDLHAPGFSEGLFECRFCATTWSVNHGLTEVVSDSQEKSFLEAISECVEGDDYALAHAI